MPIATEAATAKALDLHNSKDQQVFWQQLQTKPQMVNSESESDKTEPMKKNDLYVRLIEAIKEGNSKLENEMMSTILQRFEDVEHQQKTCEEESERKTSWETKEGSGIFVKGGRGSWEIYDWEL